MSAMYKLIIVDDNPRERVGISTIIDWERINVEVVGLCANGKQALEMVNKENPDIILTDIAMSVMNGIDMARALREQNKNVKIIFMSCHNEFDFAKSAIDLGVCDYILKPIMPTALEQAVKKVLGIYKEEDARQKEKERLIRQINASMPLFKEQFFRELLLGSFIKTDEIQERLSFLKIQLPADFQVQIISLKLNDNFMTKERVFDKYIAAYSIGEILSEVNNKSHCQIVAIQTSIIEHAILVFFDSTKESEDSILDMIISIKETINEKLGISTIMGISCTSDKIEDVPSLYHQSIYAMNTKFYGDENKLVLFNEVNELSNHLFEEHVNMNQLFDHVKQLISCGKKAEIEGFLNLYLNESKTFVKSENFVKSFTFYIMCILQIICMERKKSLNEVFGDQLLIWQKLNQFHTICDIKQWLCNILQACADFFIESYEGGYKKIVEAIKAVIHERYSQHLKMGDIAETIHFSANHANYIFKSETGKTIFDYLTEYRIEKAKELLKEPHSRIYIVAEQVGYVNKSHFCMQFKKYTGMTPDEYKNKGIRKR